DQDRKRALQDLALERVVGNLVHAGHRSSRDDDTKAVWSTEASQRGVVRVLRKRTVCGVPARTAIRRSIVAAAVWTAIVCGPSPTASQRVPRFSAVSQNRPSRSTRAPSGTSRSWISPYVARCGAVAWDSSGVVGGSVP